MHLGRIPVAEFELTFHECIHRVGTLDIGRTGRSTIYLISDSTAWNTACTGAGGIVQVTRAWIGRIDGVEHEVALALYIRRERRIGNELGNYVRHPGTVQLKQTAVTESSGL